MCDCFMYVSIVNIFVFIERKKLRNGKSNFIAAPDKHDSYSPPSLLPLSGAH